MGPNPIFVRNANTFEFQKNFCAPQWRRNGDYYEKDVFKGSRDHNGIWQSAIINAVNAWNDSNAGTNISLTSSGSSPHKIEVSYTAENWYGVCIQYLNDTGLSSGSTIILNSRTLPQGTTIYDSNFRQSTAVHEIGHLLSLDDNPITDTVNASIMNGDRDRSAIFAPTAFDIKNVKFRYMDTD